MMRGKTSLLFTSICLLATVSALPGIDQIRVLGPQGVNLWKLDKKRAEDHSFSKDSEILGQKPLVMKHISALLADFPAQWFRQPLDHFDKNLKESFHQRYWVNTRHYKPRKGAPVIVLDGGETSGEVRIQNMKGLPSPFSIV